EREDRSGTTGRARAEKATRTPLNRAIFVSTTPKAPFMGGVVTDPIRKESNTSRYNYADLSTLEVTTSVNGSEGDLDRSTRGYSAAVRRHFIDRNGKQNNEQKQTTAAHLNMSHEGSYGRGSADHFTTKSKPDDIAVQRDSGGSDGEDHLPGETSMATQLPGSTKKLSDQSDNHDLAGNESMNHPPNTTEHLHGLQSSPSKEEALHTGAIWVHKTSISADLPQSTAETIHGGGEIRHVPRETHDSTVKIEVTTDSRSSSARDVTPTILAPTMEVKPAFGHDSSSANNTTSAVLVHPTLSTTMPVATARLLKVVNETVTYLQNGTMVLTQLLFYSNGTSVHRNITEFGTTTSKASPESVPRPSPTEHIEKQPPPETTPIVPNPPGVIFGPKNDSGQSVTRCPQIEVDLSNSISPLPNSTELSGPQLPGTLVIHMCSVSYAFPTLQQPLKIYECLDTGEWTDNNNGDKCEYVAPRRKNSADL
uniref:Sushi domain-containing protein n=1 Tax=Haemonchus contortus TaxID=6289 RepID=A0A7I4XRI4_HAECO